MWQRRETLSPHLEAVLTPRAVASDAACREVKINTVVKRKYQNSLLKAAGID